jgi:signal transduction histidine kinase
MPNSAKFGPTPAIQPSEHSPIELLQARIRDLEARITEQEAERRAAAAALESAAVQRAELETNLQQALQAVECATRAKSDFLAMMSHELRTPLTGVIGYSELLGTEVLGPMTPKQQESLSRIKASTWHLVGVIDEILTLSRTEAGKEQVRSETTDIAALTRDVVSLVWPPSGDGRLVIECVDADEPRLVRTDAGKLRQILINLVGNAVKYTGEGSIAVELDRAAPDRLYVHVRDTGPGIAPEDRERIFEPFTQVDSSHTRSGSGTGLGLAICRRLARLMGGEVTVGSVPGEGSTFTLELPWNADAPRRSEAVGNPEPADP